MAGCKTSCKSKPTKDNKKAVVEEEKKTKKNEKPKAEPKKVEKPKAEPKKVEKPKAEPKKVEKTKAEPKKVEKTKPIVKKTTETKPKSSPSKPKSRKDVKNPMRIPKKQTLKSKVVNNKKKSENTKKRVVVQKSKQGKVVYREAVSEAIAATMTDDNRWVSFIKIQEYIYKYFEDVNTNSYKYLIKTTLEKMIEEKYLVQKKNSVRFSSEGIRKYKPDNVPIRKEIREVTIKEEKKVEPEPLLFITRSGRVSKALH